MKKTFLTAHSGSDGTPDNSLAFVRYALTTSADALEVDVRRNPEGRLILGHDGAAPDSPSLEEVLSLVAAHPSMAINCDLKEAGLEGDTWRLAKAAGLGGRLIFSGTVSAERYAGDEELQRNAEVFLNIEEYVPDIYLNYREIPNFELESASKIRAVCLNAHIRTVNICERLVTRRFLNILSDAGIGVSAWTVNDLPSLQWFLAAGVRNITTRNLAKALCIRERLS